jgi:hypothetical protein
VDRFTAIRQTHSHSCTLGTCSLHTYANKHTKPNPQVRLYDVLFNSESPESLGDEWLSDTNPGSLQVLQGAFITPELAAAKVGGGG